MESKKQSTKIIIIGDQAVGKSSLLMRYCDDKFTLNMMGTAGIDFKKKIFEHNSIKHTIIFYDSAGHDRFRHIIKQHYNGAKGIILVYDVTDKGSFSNVNNWMNNIKENADSSSELLLIANKVDLIEERIISKEDGMELAKKFDVNYFETSAKTGENTDLAFTDLILRILNNEKLNTQINVEKKEPEKDKILESDETNVKLTKNDKNKKDSSCFKCG